MLNVANNYFMVMLSVFMLNVIRLIVFMPNVLIVKHVPVQQLTVVLYCVIG
jgi:hypothetical protein